MEKFEEHCACVRDARCQPLESGEFAHDPQGAPSVHRRITKPSKATSLRSGRPHLSQTLVLHEKLRQFRHLLLHSTQVSLLKPFCLRSAQDWRKVRLLSTACTQVDIYVWVDLSLIMVRSRDVVFEGEYSQLTAEQVLDKWGQHVHCIDVWHYSHLS